MTNNKYTLLYIIAVMLLLTACDGQTVYNHYEHTLLSGWERNDTLTFCVPGMEGGGSYAEDIGVCINGKYPFRDICLVIEQTIFPSQTVYLDTLDCSLIDKQGHAIGQGISQYQYLFPLRRLQLEKGDSLRIAIRHDMKREILPGIANIGVKLSKSAAYGDWHPAAGK